MSASETECLTELIIQVVGKLQARRLGKVTVRFTNPLEVALTSCQVSVECAGVMRPIKEKCGDVPPNGAFEHTVLLWPRKAVEGKSLVANFGSKEMIDVYGSVTVTVAE